MGDHRQPRLAARAGLSAAVCVAMVALLASPGHAGPDRVPDPGARPTPGTEVHLPDGSVAPAVPPTPEGPLAAEIAEVQLEIATVTAELSALQAEASPANDLVAQAEAELAAATAAREAAEQQVDTLVDEVFRSSAAVPKQLLGPRLNALSTLVPVGVETPLGAEAAARRLTRAEEVERAAVEALATAEERQRDLAEQIRDLEDQLAELTERRSDLEERNTEQVAARERQREAAEQKRASEEYPDPAPVNGMRAHPRAIKAVEFALRQLGKPYLWGAEGPDRYDCSGLVLASYRSVGENLPRVAADQYWGTRDRLVTRSATVAQRGLLPGDLVFFSDDQFNWRAIGHVGIYVGDGRMVHAPSSGDVVKVAPVMWSRFFAATRVIDAVPDPDAGEPTKPPTTSPTPPPPSPTVAPPIRPIVPPPSPPGGSSPDPTTPGPSPTRSPTPDPTRSPTPDPSPTPRPSPSPAPSPDPTLAPGPSPTPAPDPSPSPLPSGGQDTPTPSATGS